jgi:hypothetical protein
MAEKKMQTIIDALGEESRNLERVCSIRIDIYVVIPKKVQKSVI